MAEKLGFPQITYLECIVELSGRTARARRNLGNGWEAVECRMPVLMTVLDTANEPRPAAAKRMMLYKRARSQAEIAARWRRQMPDASAEAQAAETTRRAGDLKSRRLLIEQWNLDDIGADLTWCGMSGSPTKVHRISRLC